MTMWLSEHPPIPGYEPVRVFGRNGAIVYLARSTRVDRPAVVQVWETRELPNAARMVGRNHRNIIEVFDVGEVDGHSYVAFEHVNAETLAQRLGSGPLSNQEARTCAMEIVSAVEFARELGAVIADLTPARVFLAQPLKLFIHPFVSIDLNLTFAPPLGRASAAHTDLTVAADVYRIGALLYAMLTTKPPISMELAHRRRFGFFGDYTHTPTPPREFNPIVSEDLEAICLKCLEVAPSDRYGSLRHLAQALTHPG